MPSNRSVPANILLPHIVYASIPDAILWLSRVFGFSEHYRYGDPVAGAMMHLGDAWFMIIGSRPGRASPAQLGGNSQMLTVFVADVDTQFARTKAAGGTILEDLHETPYGERQYGVEDLDGHRWLFAQHVRDVPPGEWGATLAAKH